ncbi:MAG: hypothetical protein ACNA7W_03265, partial [Pseudomonadales bacterium]
MKPNQRGQLMAGNERWWLPHGVPEGRTLDCQLGPLSLHIHRDRGEWHLALEEGEETDAATGATLALRDGGIDTDSFERFMFARPDETVILMPVLADRPVVIRPRQPVFLPSGEETLMYLSSPLSLRVEAGDPAVLLRELPMLRLSDTWFGPSTREGELCYSGKTHARHTLAEVPRRTHRAITPLRVRNEAATPLPLDKISLPVP